MGNGGHRCCKQAHARALHSSTLQTLSPPWTPPRAGRADRCLATAHELVHLLSVVQAVQGCRVAEKMSAKRLLRSFFLQQPPLFNCINLLLRIVAQRLRNGCDIICRKQIKRCVPHRDIRGHLRVSGERDSIPLRSWGGG